MPKINISSLVAPDIEIESNVTTIELSDQQDSEKQPRKKVSFIFKYCFIFLIVLMYVILLMYVIQIVDVRQLNGLSFRASLFFFFFRNHKHL